MILLALLNFLDILPVYKISTFKSALMSGSIKDKSEKLNSSETPNKTTINFLIDIRLNYFVFVETFINRSVLQTTLQLFE